MPTFTISQTAPIDARAGLTQNISVTGPGQPSLSSDDSSGGSSIISGASFNLDRIPFYLFLAGALYFVYKKGLL